MSFMVTSSIASWVNLSEYTLALKAILDLVLEIRNYMPPRNPY